MKSLQQALRETATQITSEDSRYNWEHVCSCNCGSLVCNLLDIDPRKLLFAFNGIAQEFVKRNSACPTYTQLALHRAETCHVTKLPLDDLFRMLYDAGLSYDDIHELEFLCNPEVLKRLGYEDVPPQKNGGKYHRQAANTAAYMNEWADMLDEKQAAVEALLAEPAEEVVCI